MECDSTEPSIHARIAARAAAVGLRQLHIYTFRDLDDPTAGGSEEHAMQVCRHYARAGLKVTLHTGRVPGQPAEVWRDGYRVVRRGGHLGVFATSVIDAHFGRMGPCDGIIEIFHGAPFFTPLWSRKPQVALVHHVHLGTWHWVLPGPLGRIGHAVEQFALPLVYRRRTMVTAAESARHEIIEHYRAHPDRVHVVHHGIDERFSVGDDTPRADGPLVVGVGRMMPQKGLDDLIEILVATKARVARLEAVIVGDGPERPRLEALVAEHNAAGWLRLAGRISDDELVELYRRAWVVASASRREGFGLTLIEGAACGTPVIATRIPGHLDAVAHDVSGLLADTKDDFVGQLTRMLTDDELRARLAAGAVKHASHFRWDESALGLLDALCGEIERSRERR